MDGAVQIIIILALVLALVGVGIYAYQKLADNPIINLGGKVAAALGSAVGWISGIPRPPKLMNCKPGDIKKLALCYPKCADIDGIPADVVAGVCWQTCKDGLKDTGAFCNKPVGVPYKLKACGPGEYDNGIDCLAGKEYLRDKGIGSLPERSCDPGWSLGPTKALCWSGAKSKIPNTSCGGKENCLGLCYTTCSTGFHPVGCNICAPNVVTKWEDRKYCENGRQLKAGLCYYGPCPAGYGTDTGTDCTKKSKPGGLGIPPNYCPSDQDKIGALCYPKCKDIQAVKDYIAKNPGAVFTEQNLQCVRTK